jgi:hypothetical protein
VKAWLRLSRSRDEFSRKVSHVRTRTANSVDAASASASELNRRKWSATSRPIPITPHAAGVAISVRPSRSSRIARDGACHAAAAISRIAAGHNASRIVPST